MKRLNLALCKFIFIILILSVPKTWAESPTKFSLHLINEPSSLKPWEQRNSNGLYLFGQLYGTLLKYRDGKMIPSMAAKCDFKGMKLVQCTLKKGLRLSDGTPVEANDFRRSWLELLKPEHHAFRADLLFDINNAEDFYLGKVDASKVGIEAKGLVLTIHLKNVNPDFLFRLSSPLLSTWKQNAFNGNFDPLSMAWSGAYKLIQWQAGKRITLQHRVRPQVLVDFLFVSEDSVALNLFEKGELQFLRRLPTLFNSKYKGKPEYFEVEFLRFDFIGFGPELKDLLWLRKALSQSLDFSELNKLLDIHGSYGCPALPTVFFQKLPCVAYDPNAESSISKELRSQIPVPLKIVFATQGGDDYQKVMEWLQDQWRRHLHIELQLEHQDFKIFSETLKTKAPTVFRRGIIPEDPSCLAALDSLKQTSNPYPPSSVPKFEQAFKKLQLSTITTAKKRSACTEAVQALIDSNWILPTGPVHFSFLVKPNWVAWHLNEMNQLDLEDLSNTNANVK